MRDILTSEDSADNSVYGKRDYEYENSTSVRDDWSRDFRLESNGVNITLCLLSVHIKDSWKIAELCGKWTNQGERYGLPPPPLGAQ